MDFDYPVQAEKLAKNQGARQFLIISAIGANAQSNLFYSRVKGEVEEALKQLQLPSLHIFRPSLLLGNRKEFRFGEKAAAILSPIYTWLLVGKLNKYKPIQAKQVAHAMFQSARKNTSGEFMYEWVQMRHNVV
ncbi:hypothetical protein D3C80_1093420 [compost metagenome]